ncbi:hypothetical protein GCM10017771_11000 [Streptomyces capitiformicae]|uniref:BPP domain-containing protein n=1 Tax=Streptomyces capitiformicae TaxID=2014920 RepID=A0A919GGM4_9ACTN|nr:hypothetical protein GCM10017771_11000 [Streptomyces capitiformicae]
MPADLGAKPKLIDKVREYGVPATFDEATEECVAGADPGYGGTHLSADVEGLTILDEGDGDGDGYLLASSQGDNTFAAYDREVSDNNEYESGFRIAAGTVDGSEEYDGAAVLNAPWAPATRTACWWCRTGTTPRTRRTRTGRPGTTPTSSSSIWASSPTRWTGMAEATQ